MNRQDSSVQAGSAGRDGARERHARRRSALIGVALIAALAIPAGAQAAGAPKVTTGAARDVSYASATLAGSLNPNGSDTSYYFQYGPTRAYGSQTPIADAGSGSKAVAIRTAVGSLQPQKTYHYRLVAVNASGPAIGTDQTLRTTLIPLMLAQLLASPNPVPFGDPVIIQGTLAGTNNANRTVVLQASPFPFTGGFFSTGLPGLTSATGEYKFLVPALTQSTQFRVFTTPSNPVVSPVVTANVAVRVSSHVAHTKRRGFVRIFGTVTPAANGQQVGFLRIAQGRGILIGGTVLRALNATSSQYSRVVRAKPGAYRVLVKVAPGPMLAYGPGGLISAYGTPLLIH
jgi:hypothetical protein